MKKDWTVLIYANGNNELEPEIYKSFQDLNNLDSSKNINVVIQIGRETKTLVQLMRPNDKLPTEKETWTGVRLYSSQNNNLNLYKNLNETNMADPKILYEFLVWGVTKYPAKHYMLILGGHSFEYMGTITDYTGNIPYILGIPEMAKALNLAKKKTGKKIDIFFLDTCYMNMAEILYEINKHDKPVNKLLTYIENGPIKGAPLDKIINILAKNSHLELDLLLKEIIKNLHFDLVAFDLNSKRLEKIKSLTNDIAKLIFAEKKPINFKNILNEVDPEKAWYPLVDLLNKNISSLIIDYKKIKSIKNPLLDIAHVRTTNHLASYYFRLSFSKNNAWSYLLGKDLFQEQIINEVHLKPLVLPAQALVTLICIMNPNSEKEEIENIFNNLLEYKKWKQYTNFQLK